MTCGRCSRELEVDSAFCRFCGTAVGGGTRRRLNRLPAEGKIAGVCAGIAAHFETDVTLVRLAWVILSIVPGLFIGGILAYAAAWLLMPAVETTGRPVYAGKRLRRSSADSRIAGGCGGLREYIGIDATIVRLAWVILSIYPGAIICGLIAYLVAWVIIPQPPVTPLQPVTSPV